MKIGKTNPSLTIGRVDTVYPEDELEFIPGKFDTMLVGEFLLRLQDPLNPPSTVRIGAMRDGTNGQEYLVLGLDNGVMYVVAQVFEGDRAGAPQKAFRVEAPL